LSYDIGIYAERTNLTKFAAMQQAIDIAAKALCANENKMVCNEKKKEGTNHKKINS